MAGGEHQAGFDPAIRGTLPVSILLFLVELQGSGDVEPDRGKAGFKAARRAAHAANTARSPQLPLTLPQRRRLAPVGWREKLKRRAADDALTCLNDPYRRSCR